MSGERLTTAISGSFKFKDKIDGLREEFADHGVEVLEPSKGWHAPPSRLHMPPDFRPLPDEQGMTIRQIEDKFLDAVERADFLYVYTEDGYIGTMTSAEIGYALGHACKYGREKPVYACEALDVWYMSECDLDRYAYLKANIAIAGIAQIVEIERERKYGASSAAQPDHEHTATGLELSPYRAG